jgi:glycosyltransferase involved in cell wall biosynthesis
VRVLLINYEYPPVGAGAATAAQAIARSLVASRNPTTVLTAGYGNLLGTQTEEGVQVVRLPSRRRHRESATIYEMISFMRLSLGAIRRIVRAEQIEGMIAFFSFPSGPAAWWAHRDAGVPYLVSLRGGDVPGAESGLSAVHWLLAPSRRCILRAARAVTANSPGLKAMSERVDPPKVHLVPNGVDTQYFIPRAADGNKDGPFRLLFVGRFQAQKNLFWLLDQLANLRRTSSRPFNLDLVGDGPERTGLSARIQELGLGEAVHFHGWVERGALRGHYQSADLIINPSHYEGMPNVLLEAMACGRPVLASRVPGNETVVVDQVTGWLYAPNDSRDFADRLSTLMARDDLTTALGQSARKYAVQWYSWDRCAQSYLDLLATPSPASTTA